MLSQIWRHGRINDVPHRRAGRGETADQEDVPLGDVQGL